MRRVVALGLLLAIAFAVQPAPAAHLVALYRATGEVTVSSTRDFTVSGNLLGGRGAVIQGVRLTASPEWSASFWLRWTHGSWVGTGPTVGASGHALTPAGAHDGWIRWAGGSTSGVSIKAVAYGPRSAVASGRINSGSYRGSNLVLTIAWIARPGPTSPFAGEVAFI